MDTDAGADRHVSIMVDSLIRSRVMSGHCWFVNASIENELVEFLIDPGAMVTAI